MKKHSKARLLAFALALSIAITAGTTSVNHQISHARLRDSVAMHIAEIHSTIKYVIDQVYVMQALVIGADGQDIDLSEISSLLQHTQNARYIRYIALAPEGIVADIYPRSGNEALLGTSVYDYSYPTSEDALRARLRGEPVISAPFSLPNGDQVIAVRLPVDLRQEDGTKREWGLVSLCMIFPDMLGDLTTDVLKERGCAYRISMLDKNSGHYTEVLNHHYFDYSHNISQEFTVDQIRLRIDASPLGGWLHLHDLIYSFLHTLLAVFVCGFVLEYATRRVRRLRQGATQDDLTGLLKRTAGEKQIEAIINSRGFQQGAFLLMDIDHFKDVNDSLGHQVGDDALIESARIFRRLFREQDVICRLGGDEFIVFLPYASNTLFLDKKLKLLLDATRRTISSGDFRVPISLSVGVALAPQHGITFKELYGRADMALYRAKQLGRDRAVFYAEQTNAQSEPPHGT